MEALVIATVVGTFVGIFSGVGVFRRFEARTVQHARVVERLGDHGRLFAG